MIKPAVILAVVCAANVSAQVSKSDVADWQRRAQNVTIVRDDWGIPHVHGKTDADAVFGLMYAQAEDDFNRVETNFINSMGRLAEVEGQGEVYRDLRMKLFIDPDSMKAQYAASPAFLKALMVAWADGLNFYLYKNPRATPRLIRHFEPWMALTFSEGSIGGDIEHVNLSQLEAFYARGGGATGAGQGAGAATSNGVGAYTEPTGSNGIAIAPMNTLAHHALLLINPHTSFFFRAEVQATSDEGLNAYGAVTWGQFFVYQGFNERAGWMHTTSGADDLDEYAETITKRDGVYYYQRGNAVHPVGVSHITVPYKTASGAMRRKVFTVYRTIHGPIIREANGKWISIRMMHEPVKALIQSYTRTKARTYKAFRQTMELHTNSSNNTIFADADGDIAYFHANFIPRRDARFDWTKPVDGSNPATDWHGLLSVEESPHLLNPASGWLYNSNNWPWSAAGSSSPRRSDYPAYVESGSESFRGLHAVRLLQNKKDFTLNSLVTTAFDSYLPGFAALIPPLLTSYDELPAANPLKTSLSEQIAELRGWNYRWMVSSIPTSLAVFWGEALGRAVSADALRTGMSPDTYMVAHASAAQRLQALVAASNELTADFGSWKTPWGDINRFQRLTGDIVQPFNDAAPSIPVGFVSSRWGSLASFGARAYPGTKKWYGTSGNSFVAVVEFGDSVRARAVTAGGESGHPDSRHFNDEARRYATGDLRTVYFYPNQLIGHTERTYHPGD